MSAPEPDPTASLHKLATDLFEATMASLRVQLRYNPERDQICARMPAHLLSIREANRLAQRAEVTARLDLQGAVEKDQWFGEWGRRFARTRDTAPEDLPALRQVLIAEMKQEHALLAAQARAAEQAEEDIQNEWCAAENRLTSEWHEEHIPRLQALIAAFGLELERHRHRIAGLVDLTQIKLGNLAEGASSASQVLLKFADRVVHFRSRSCDGLDPDHLKVEVEREVGWLVRSGNGSLVIDPPAGWPPPEHPSVSWNDLSEMERDFVAVFLNAGKPAVFEVPLLAKKARGRDASNRHDKDAAQRLDQLGLTKLVGRTGRELIAVPRGMPAQE